MQSLAQKLQKAPFFGKFPQADREFLAEHALQRTFEKGEYVFHQGDIWARVLFVTKGSLEWAILSVSGREQVLFTVDPYDIFFGHSIFDGKAMPASLKATQKTTLFLWDKDTLLPLLYRHPETLWEITGMLTTKMRTARDIIYGLAFQPVAGRLAALLLERFAHPEDSAVERDLTLPDIASRVASSPEVVCRILHQFQDDGVLTVTRATITLQDRSALEEFTEPD